jgi:endonuclease/exonuclease/phosphatase family metal-dependent hydrolase
MPRAALEVTLDTPLGPLRVLNAHLEYFSSASAWPRSNACANCSAKPRARGKPAAHRMPRPGGPDSPFAPLPRPAPAAMLLGDFNMLPGSAVTRAARARFDGAPPWRDAWALAHPGEPACAHGGPARRRRRPSPSTMPSSAPDLAARVRTAAGGRRGATGSDHQPLLLELGYEHAIALRHYRVPLPGVSHARL